MLTLLKEVSTRMLNSDLLRYSREYNIRTKLFPDKTSFMKPESLNSTYKYKDTFEDIDPPYLPTKVMEKDPKFNFPEPKRAAAAKSSRGQKSKGFWDCFCDCLCCCCHLLEA